MFMGLGMPIPDLANKPGPGRPGFPVPGGGVDPRSFSFRVAGSDEVVIKANPQNAGGTFSIKWPNDTIVQYTGNQSNITAPSNTPGIVSINLPDAGDSSYCDDFAVLGAAGSVSKNAVTEVISWGNQGWNSLVNAFTDCINLTGIGTTSLKTSTSGQLTSLFQSCTSLTALDMTNWNLIAGARIQSFCKGCTNLAVVEKPTLGIKLVTNSQEAFSNVGTAVAGGCAFNLSGLNISTSEVINIYRFFIAARINGILSDFSNWVFNSSIDTIITQMFSSAQVVGQNSFLKLPGWTTLRTNSLSNTFYAINSANEFDGTENLTLDITNFYMSNVATMPNMLGGTNAAAGNKISNILGLNTLLSPASGCNLSTSFQGCRFLKLTTAGNFSSAFMNGANPTTVKGMFLNLGQGLTSNFGVAPNLHSLNLSTAGSSFAVNGFVEFLRSIKTSTLPDFSNITWPTLNISFNLSFFEANLSGTNLHLDISPPDGTSLLVSDLSGAFRSIQGISKITLGNNVNLSSCTTFSTTFLSSGNAATPLDVTLPTNADYGNVGNWSNAFTSLYGINNQTLSTCVGDTLIRRLHATSLNANQTALNLVNTKLTGSPSVVNSQVTALETAGWTITSNSTDAVMPFVYTSTMGQGTSQTPTGSPFSGTFSVVSSPNPTGATVDSATGELTAPNTGNVTIRKTLADGCYNEQALSVILVLPKINNVYSMEFDGSSDYIDIGLRPSLAATEFTWSFWIYPTSTSGTRAIYSQSSSSLNFSSTGYLAVNGATLALDIYLSGSYSTGPNFVTLNEWQHIAATRTYVGGSTYIVRLYRNGVVFNSTGAQLGGGGPASNGYIGSWIYNGPPVSRGLYFGGKIDEGALFDVALTDSQILAIYNGTATVGGVAKTANLNSLPTPPIKWYRMGD